MSDYRCEWVKRNEIDCLHVMVDSNSLVEIADTHIPLDDILASATEQGLMTIGTSGNELAQKIITLKQKAIRDVDTATESDWPGLLSGALDDIETLCNEHLSKGK